MISFAYAAPVTIDEEFLRSPASGKKSGPSGALKVYMATVTVSGHPLLSVMGTEESKRG